MVAAFLVSATISLLSAILCLVLYGNNGIRYTNPIDLFWRRILCNPVQSFVGPERARKWANMLFGMIMAISDQQLITGIALLSAAMRNLEKRNITVYHFNTIMNLAWFSSNTHLLALCVMRSFMETRALDNVISYTRSHAPLPRILRIIAMLVLAGLLLHCSAVAGYELWDDNVNCPASCITRGKRAGAPYRQMIVTYILVIIGYTFMIARVTPLVGNFCVEKLGPWFVSRDQKMNGKLENRPSRLKLYSLQRKAVLVIWYIVTSDFETMVEMVGWYALGLYWTFSDRKEGHQHMEAVEREKENHIGFGQLVPLLLIVLATLGAMEAYMCK